MRRVTVGVVILCTIAMLATACGGGGSGTGSTTGTSSGSTPSQSTAASSAPTGTLSIAQGIYPETLNAELSTVQDTLNVDTQINEPLMNFNYKTREVEPNLAISWKATDSTTWTFKLRQGVKFTNGEDFNAEEAAWNINWILDPANKAPIATDLTPVASAKATGTDTLEIKTKTPDPNLPIALTRVFILPEKYFSEQGAAGFLKTPVGTGPYEFVSALNGQQVKLKANTGYWGAKPKIANLVFYAIADDAQRANALQTGEVQIANHLTPDLVETLKSAQGINISAIPSLRLVYVILDTTKPGPIQNKEVRQALNYAIDKDAIVKNLLGGYAKPLDGQPLSPEYFGYDKDISAYPYDPDKAKQMLSDAGYPADQLTVDFFAPKGRYMDDSQVAQAIANQLQQIGITVNLQVSDWGTFINQFLKKSMTPMIFIGYSTEPDADFQLGINRCGQVYSYYCNKDFDALLAKAGATIDDSQRQALYAQAAQIMHDDAPYIYLYQEDTIWGVAQSVQGFTPLPDERIVLDGVSVGN